MKAEAISLFAQRCFQGSPVIVLGSGASAPFGLPNMDQLQKHLVGRIVPDGEQEEGAWLLVRTALANGDHLEQAMAGKALPDGLVEKIVSETWSCMCESDGRLFQEIVQRQRVFAFGQVIDKLFQTSNRTIDVVTTNYDRVAEYACVSSGFSYFTGFVPGYISSREPNLDVFLTRNGRKERTVRIWKVHGSLDWFVGADGEPVCAPLFGSVPAGLVPLIVTPGVSKYQRAYDEPFRSTIQGADAALADAKSYICFGFGFRDAHIEPKIVTRCRKANVPIVVVSHTLTQEASSFLKNKIQHDFLVLEKSGTGTLARTSDNWDGVLLEGEFWSIDGFMKLVS